MVRKALAFALAVGVDAIGGTAADAAPVVTINGLSYDLAQFDGANVTTNVSSSDIFGSTFDNPNGIDGVTLGELAEPQFGFDPGDRISLGIDDGDQDMLTLTYGSPVLIGPGDSMLFVVFEQSGDTTVDPEGRNFEISFNGGMFVNASTSGSVTATGGVVGAGGTEQNQIVFDLTHADFGFSIGDTISTVKIRNLVILGSSEDDPDFLFAARAGTGQVFASVAEPEVLAMLGLGLAVLAFSRRRPAMATRPNRAWL